MLRASWVNINFLPLLPALAATGSPQAQGHRGWQVKGSSRVSAARIWARHPFSPCFSIGSWKRAMLHRPLFFPVSMSAVHSWRTHDCHLPYVLSRHSRSQRFLLPRSSLLTHCCYCRAPPLAPTRRYFSASCGCLTLPLQREHLRADTSTDSSSVFATVPSTNEEVAGIELLNFHILNHVFCSDLTKLTSLKCC